MILFVCICVKFVFVLWNDLFPSVESRNWPLKQVLGIWRSGFLWEVLWVLCMADTEVNNCFLYRKWDTPVHNRWEARASLDSLEHNEHFLEETIQLDKLNIFFQLKNQLLMNKLRSLEVFEKMLNFINNWIVQMRVAYGLTAMNRLRGVRSGKK